MTNKISYLKAVLLALIFGLLIIGNIEAQINSRLNGRWVTAADGFEVELMLDNGNYDQIINGNFFDRGTYTTTGDEFIMTTTHVFGETFNQMLKISGLESRWYSINEFIIVIRSILAELGFSDRDIANIVSTLIKTYSYNYSLDASALKLIDGSNTIIYNKK